MALFKKEKIATSYIGVDLTPDAIKLVELKNFKGKPQLVTYGYAQTKNEVMRGSFIENVNVTASLLKEVWQKAGCKSDQCLAALPVSRTFTSILKVQQLAKKDLKDSEKIKEILSKEVEKILPMPIKEMQFDYTLINEDDFIPLKETDMANDVKYLITAAANNVVKKYTEIFAQSGLTLANLDIEPFAQVRSLVGNDKSLILIVDMGENNTTLSIINNSIPVYNRSIEIGGALITKKLSEIMSITLPEAEQYKIDLPILMEQQGLKSIPKPIEMVIAPIISEIKYLLKIYYEQVSKEKEIDRILLTGGGSLLSGLQEYFVAQLNIRTYPGDPWARVVYPTELSSVLKEVGPRFSIALGLAMTKIK